MSYSITCSTKTLTLTKTSLYFISVSALCNFAMVPGVYILLPPRKQEVHYSSWEGRCTNSTVHSSKLFKALRAIILLRQGYCWIGENTRKELFSCVVMLIIIRPSRTLQFHFFSISECLWTIFSLLSF